MLFFVLCLLLAPGAAGAGDHAEAPGPAPAPPKMGMGNGEELLMATEYEEMIRGLRFEQYGNMTVGEIDSDVSLDLSVCDDASSGSYADLPVGTVNFLTQKMVTPGAICAYHRHAEGFPARPYSARCATEGSPIRWSRRVCEHCADHLCVENKIEYFMDPDDDFFSSREGRAHTDMLHERTGAVRFFGEDADPLKNVTLPIYAPGEPPVADRHRPLWATWYALGSVPPPNPPCFPGFFHVLTNRGSGGGTPPGGNMRT